MTLTTASLGGVRPADYDPRLVAEAISLRDRSLFDLYAHLTVSHHFFDTGQPARAQERGIEDFRPVGGPASLAWGGASSLRP